MKTKEKINRNIFLGGLIIVLFLLILFNLEHRNQKPSTLLPTPLPTIITNVNKDWKNSIWNGLSINFLSNWEADNNGVSEIRFISPERYGGNIEPLYYFVFMQRIENPDGLSTSFKELINKKVSAQDFSYTLKRLNSYIVYKTEDLPSPGGCLEAYVTNDDLVYARIGLCPYSSKNPADEHQGKYLDIFNQMLLSFKFVK